MDQQSLSQLIDGLSAKIKEVKNIASEIESRIGRVSLALSSIDGKENSKQEIPKIPKARKGKDHFRKILQILKPVNEENPMPVNEILKRLKSDRCKTKSSTLYSALGYLEKNKLIKRPRKGYYSRA